MIRHPGRGIILECESFEQAMKDWFEGFNPPILVTNGEWEDAKASYRRVSMFFAGKMNIPA